MKEIKFRAWGRNSREFLYYYEGGKKIVGLTLKNIQAVEDIGGWEFSQFTGLHDKDGKEIYEGDVLKSTYPHEALLVEYDNDNAAFYLKTRDPAEYKYLGTHVSCYEVEVIGNIYENPELFS